MIAHAHEPLLARTTRRVSPEERRGRNGHHGAVIVLRAGTDAGRLALGAALERALWAHGVQSAFVEGDADLLPGLVEGAHALARAGFVAIVGATRAPGARMLRGGLGWVTVHGADLGRLDEVLHRVLPLLVGREADFVEEV